MKQHKGKNTPSGLFDDPIINGSEDMLEVHISKALFDAYDLRKKLRDLRGANVALESELQNLRKTTAGARKDKGVKREEDVEDLHIRIEDLEKKVDRLKKGRKKDKAKIQKMRDMQLQKEVESLGDEDEVDPTGDISHSMRKLLRRFQDLMLNSVLDEEPCPVCFLAMELNKCSSLPCEHLVCDNCLRSMAKLNTVEEFVRCPLCRAEHPRDEVQVVHYTAVTRWDALLDVAKAWAAIDLRGEEETSEEEREEQWLDDGDTDSSAPTNELDPGARETASKASESDGHSSPERLSRGTAQIKYAQSPTKEKKKRMESLILSRQNKRRRY